MQTLGSIHDSLLGISTSTFSRYSKVLQAADADIGLAVSQYDAMIQLTSEMRIWEYGHTSFILQIWRFGKESAAWCGLLGSTATITLRPGETRGDDVGVLHKRTNLKRNVFLAIFHNITTKLLKHVRKDIRPYIS